MDHQWATLGRPWKSFFWIETLHMDGPWSMHGHAWESMGSQYVFLVGAFSLKEKSPTITVRSFFSRRFFP